MISNARDATTVHIDWLTQQVIEIFVAAGLDERSAATVADALVDADCRGMASHGTMLVPMYVERLRRGSVSTRTRAETVVDLGAIAVLDAGHGPGVLAADQAMELAVHKARAFGVGAVGVRHAFHFGAAGRYVRTAARAGLIGVAMANTRPLMPAPGGGHAVTGNNPLAIGVPARGREPIVLDMALSAVALGRVRLAHANQQSIPLGWATDAAGRDTTDPQEAVAGMLLPTGGHKGFGLALMVDVLTGVLSGGSFGSRVKGLYADTSVPNDCAHFLLALDPAMFGQTDEFADNVAELARQVTAPPYAPGTTRVWLPGERSAERHRESAADGVAVDDVVLAEMRALATELGVLLPPTRQSVPRRREGES